MLSRLTLYMLVLTAVVNGSDAAWAQPKTEGWIFSPNFGAARPSLSVLSDHVFKAPFAGESQVVVDLPEDVVGEASYPTEQFVFQNDLQPVRGGPEAGLEFRRMFGGHNDFIMGISALEIARESRSRGAFPLQGSLGNMADYIRRAQFSYTRYYLGLQHYFYPRPSKFNLYFNLAINEFFDIDYRENHVFSFLTGPPAGFKRIFVLETQATGIVMLGAGLGADVQLADRFSIGVEGGFLFGVFDGGLKGLKRRTDINDGDRLDVIRASIDLGPDGSILVLNPDGRTRTQRQLDMNGWRGVVKFNIAF